jgi:drug/metabolite transporter (DMT)-like permease
LRLRIGASLATVYVVWGSTYLAIAVAIRSLPPLAMSSIRFGLAGLLLYAWAYRGGGRPSRREWVAAAVVGGALLVVGNGGIAWAEQRVSTGVAALLVAVMPLWMALLDRGIYGRAITRVQSLGLLVGLAGVVLLVGPTGGSLDLLGAVVCLGACLFWAAGSLYARGAPLPSDPLRAASLQMLAAAVALAIVAGADGEWAATDVAGMGLGSVAALAYLVLVGSILAYTAYGWLLANAPTPLVATYAYVNPVVAVLLGWAFNGERVGWRTLLAAGAIVVSVALTVSGGRRLRRAPTPAYEAGLRVAAANGRAGLSGW